MEWFHLNHMKAKADKFQLMYIGHAAVVEPPHLTLRNNEIVEASSSITVLGIELDYKLNFKNHVVNICTKTSKQLNALKRNRRLLNKDCKTIIHKTFISSNFNYSPIAWMFTSKYSINMLERLNKRSLRFVTNDMISEYADLCEGEGCLNIHRQLIKSVAIIMYKVKNEIAPSYVCELFTPKTSNYSLRNSDGYDLPKFNTITFGRKSLRYYGPKLWNSIPIEPKQCNTLPTFKSSLTEWLVGIHTSELDFI